MRLLVVEDEWKIAEALKNGLEAEGYEVVAAASGEDGPFEKKLVRTMRGVGFRLEGAGNCREAIGSILEESDRLRQLIDALLQLSRADAGEIQLRREAVDLGELVRETVEFLSVLAEEKRQAIRTTASCEAVVRIDRAGVRQALTNLLDNAIKYAPPDSDIDITIGVTGDSEAFVEFADCGVGIPEKDIPHIFDRFYRVDKGRSREMGGAGLGLAIARWAVENNGGRIEIESAINRGSKFRVFFPT